MHYILADGNRISQKIVFFFFLFQSECSGVYAEEEKKFVFNNVIVGRKATARFKISNNQKVPCDVVFTVKPVAAKGASKQQDIFEVEPSRAQVMNHSYVYATVTFTPPSMQVRANIRRNRGII